MSSKIYHVLGIMSGTSLDGIDVVRVRFDFSDAWNFKILEAKTHPYPEEWHDASYPCNGVESRPG